LLQLQDVCPRSFGLRFRLLNKQQLST